MKPLQVAVNTENLGLEKIIDSDRYHVKNFLAKGCWGKVYHAQDTLTGEEVAIKVLDPNEIAQLQMEERNIDPIKAMKKEALKLAACSNVVPRKLELDEQGRPFIVMPRYEQTLADVLNDNGERKYLNKGLSIEDVNKYIKDIGTGISETHNKLKRTHGDLKPDNIVLDEKGNALLTDFGSSTCASTGRSVSPRDNLGFVYTRAPENFKNGSHPEKQSDIWALDAIKFRLYTGKYPLEKEIANSKDPGMFLEQVGDKGVNNIIIEKIKNNKKNIPRKARKPLKKGLDVNPKKRYSSIDDSIKDFDKSTKPGFFISHPYLATGALLGALGVFVAGGWIVYDVFSKESAIKDLVSAVEEGKKYKVEAKWNGETLEISNNLVTLDIRANDYKEKKSFTSNEVWYLNPGSKFNATVIVRDVARPRAREEIKGEVTPSLKGKAYVQGYSGEDFWISPGPHDQSFINDMGAAIGITYLDIKVPKDIPRGNHFLALELYAPDGNDSAWYDDAHEKFIFSKPGKAIARKLVPILIGDLEEKNRVNIGAMNLNWYHPYISMTSQEPGETWYRPRDINTNLIYEVSIPEMNYKKEFNREGDNTVNGYWIRAGIPNAPNPGPRTLRVITKNEQEEPISYGWMPITWQLAYTTPEGKESYEWALDLPGPEFSERLINFRENLFRELGIKQVAENRTSSCLY